jgi:hypothetical protein
MVKARACSRAQIAAPSASKIVFFLGLLLFPTIVPDESFERQLSGRVDPTQIHKL